MNNKSIKKILTIITATSILATSMTPVYAGNEDFTNKVVASYSQEINNIIKDFNVGEDGKWYYSREYLDVDIKWEIDHNVVKDERLKMILDTDKAMRFEDGVLEEKPILINGSDLGVVYRVSTKTIDTGKVELIIDIEGIDELKAVGMDIELINVGGHFKVGGNILGQRAKNEEERNIVKDITLSDINGNVISKDNLNIIAEFESGEAVSYVDDYIFNQRGSKMLIHWMGAVNIQNTDTFELKLNDSHKVVNGFGTFRLYDGSKNMEKDLIEGEDYILTVEDDSLKVKFINVPENEDYKGKTWYYEFDSEVVDLQGNNGLYEVYHTVDNSGVNLTSNISIDWSMDHYASTFAKHKVEVDHILYDKNGNFKEVIKSEVGQYLLEGMNYEVKPLTNDNFTFVKRNEHSDLEKGIADTDKKVIFEYKENEVEYNLNKKIIIYDIKGDSVGLISNINTKYVEGSDYKINNDKTIEVDGKTYELFNKLGSELEGTMNEDKNVVLEYKEVKKEEHINIKYVAVNEDGEETLILEEVKKELIGNIIDVEDKDFENFTIITNIDELKNIEVVSGDTIIVKYIEKKKEEDKITENTSTDEVKDLEDFEEEYDKAYEDWIKELEEKEKEKPTLPVEPEEPTIPENENTSTDEVKDLEDFEEEYDKAYEDWIKELEEKEKEKEVIKELEDAYNEEYEQWVKDLEDYDKAYEDWLKELEDLKENKPEEPKEEVKEETSNPTDEESIELPVLPIEVVGKPIDKPIEKPTTNKPTEEPKEEIKEEPKDITGKNQEELVSGVDDYTEDKENNKEEIKEINQDNQREEEIKEEVNIDSNNRTNETLPKTGTRSNILLNTFGGSFILLGLSLLFRKRN